jgi:GT2 family glycosyltransferase
MPNRDPRSLTILMTTFNQWHLTRRCLDSLLENSRITERLIIVENLSTDETRIELETYRPRFAEKNIDLVIHLSTENLGFAKGMNAALSIAREKGITPYIAVANNDTYLGEGWDEALVASLKRHRADCVSPFVLETPFTDSTPIELKKLANRNRNRKRVQWSMILGVFTREVIDEIGLFDPRYFVGYEDADLKHRFDLKGKRYFTVGNSVIWHKSKGTRGEDQSIENFGLKVYLEIWGYDPRISENRFIEKMRRAFRKWRMKFGYL